MRAIVAEEFGGYQNLKVADIPRPAVSDAPGGSLTTLGYAASRKTTKTAR
ncbi:MAG: hypothetical protein WBD97_19295 [Pseudolabrys sp.]